VVCIVGKIAQDVGMVCTCGGVIPIQFGWFLRFPSLHALVFLQKLFVTCFCCIFSSYFVLLFRNGKREERWEGRPRGRCKVNFFVHIKLRIINNSIASK